MCGVGNYASFARIKKLVLDHFLLVLAIIEPLIDNSNRLYYCHRLGYDDASFTTNGNMSHFNKSHAHKCF